MIFDTIAKEIEFKIADTDGDWEYVVSSGNYHLAEILNSKGKISMLNLLFYFEDDEKYVTISFKEDDNRYTTATVRFYDKEDTDSLIAKIVLVSKDSFSSLLSEYCGEM